MLFEDLEERDDLINKSFIKNGDCRTTPDTLGLLKIFYKTKEIKGLCEGFIINFKCDQ